MTSKNHAIVKAPYKYTSLDRPYVFLAGSIEMGKAVDWQQRCEQELIGATILNPRRDNWDSSWIQSIDHPEFFEQVTWELEAQEKADLVIFYFAPETNAPITLLELGLSTNLLYTHKIVCCPINFYRRGNVEIVCERYGIELVETLDDLIKETNGWLNNDII